MDRRDLLKTVRFSLRGSGVILKAVPATVMRMASRGVPVLNALAVGHSATAKRARAALLFKEAVTRIVRDDGICTPRGHLEADFVEKVLGHVGEGLRTDSKTVLAYHMVGTAKARSFQLVGVASYGEASVEDTEDRAIEFMPGGGVSAAVAGRLNADLRNQRLVELDLLCSGGTVVPGLATLLAAFCVATAATQKKRQAHKYVGCIIDCVNPGMTRIAAVLGFRSVWLRKAGVQGTVKRYMVLSGDGWVGRIGERLTRPPAICVTPGSAMCT